MIVQNGQVRFANQKVIKNIGEEQEFLNLIHDKDRKKVCRFLQQVRDTNVSSTLGSVQLRMQVSGFSREIEGKCNLFFHFAEVVTDVQRGRQRCTERKTGEIQRS